MAEKPTYEELEQRLKELEKTVLKCKQAEEGLRESEQRYKGLIEGINEAIYRMSLPDGRYEYVSPAAKSVFGYSSKEFIDTPFLIREIIHPEFADYFQEKWAALLESKIQPTYEYKIIDRKGKERWIIQSNIGVFDHRGNVVAIEGICRDITKRRHAEEALFKQQYFLQKAQEIGHIGTWELDIKKNELIWADENYRIFGLPIGTKLTYEIFLDCVHPDDREYVDTKWNAAFTGKPYDIEHRLIVDDKTKWVREKAELEFNEKGECIKGTGFTQDITERKLTEQALRKSEERLQQAQKMESIGTLSGGIAHDFNNILFSIVINTEMLLEDIPENSPLRRNLNEVFSAAMRASKLVKQILAFSRQDSHEIKLMRMQPVLKEALKLIRSTIPTSIEIKQSINKDCGAIKADPTQFHQVVMNLATNAYHAMEDTGGELKLNLKEIELGKQDLPNPDMKQGPYACLTVSDTGTGIDKDVKNRMYDPYYTTKKQGKGTGMGLAVVHGIVINAGGGIQVNSMAGKGTEFNVYLPIVQSSFEQQETQTREPILHGTERILLMDDEEAIVFMEKQMLERLGYSVVSRTSSVEALEAFRADPGKFDLVITDMAMPNLSGDQLVSELIKIRSDIPVVLCTGFSERMPEERAKTLGIKGFLMKPIVMKDISKTIREVLDSKESSVQES